MNRQWCWDYTVLNAHFSNHSLLPQSTTTHSLPAWLQQGQEFHPVASHCWAKLAGTITFLLICTLEGSVSLQKKKKKKKKTHCVTSWKELLSLFRRNHAGLSSGLQCCFFDQHSRGNSEYSQKYIQVLVIIKLFINILIFSSVCQSCPTLCSPIDCSTPGFPVHRQTPELAQTHVHRVGPCGGPLWTPPL